jgi:hypothetical protein
MRRIKVNRERTGRPRRHVREADASRLADEFYRWGEAKWPTR